MAGDAPPVTQAWEELPAPGAMVDVSATFARDRIERILTWVIAIGSSVIGTQAFIDAFSEVQPTEPVRIVQLVVVYIPLAVFAVASLIGRGVKRAALVVAIAITAVLVTWSAALNGIPSEVLHAPWIYLLVDVAVAATVLSCSRAVQFTAAVVLPVLYGVQRLIRGDFERSYWILTVFDVSFAIILGAVIVTLAWVFRTSADRVDAARQEAIATYTGATAAVAAEQERVAVAALMHDSVLAALLAAERADSERSRSLAVSMASEALTRLANSEATAMHHGNDQPVETVQVVIELRRTLAELGADAAVEVHGPGGLIPDRVARAIVLAARQAIMNAVSHARGRGLHVTVNLPRDDAIQVVVVDSGPGFDTVSIAEDRLGIRASITARMAGVAGRARLESSDAGTTVALEWGNVS